MDRQFEPQVFYTDTAQCAEWDEAMLGDNPALTVKCHFTGGYSVSGADGTSARSEPY